jgi:1-acyl-sn-glycerol-3-phosphate acyltransferase
LKRVLNFLHIVFVLMWAGFSITVYGITTILVRIISERVSRFIAKLWCIHINFFSGVKTYISGLEKLAKNKNYIFVANHQSIYDIFTLYEKLPFRISFIAKKSLFFIPVFGWGIAAIGHIAVDRSNPAKARKSIKRAQKTIKEKKRSIIIFPEGTRTLTGEIGDFKLGSFGLALQTGIDIVPVSIFGAYDVLHKGSLMLNPGTIYLDIANPISISQFNRTDKFKLTQIVRNEILSLFEKRRKSIKISA